MLEEVSRTLCNQDKSIKELQITYLRKYLRFSSLAINLHSKYSRNCRALEINITLYALNDYDDFDSVASVGALTCEL